MRFIFALLLFLSVTFAQVNDKNFKEKINGGVVVAVFTSEWQEQDLDDKILKGVDGYQDCEIIYVREGGRGLKRKYIEILKYFGLLNFIYLVFCEVFYMITLSPLPYNSRSSSVDDKNLNPYLEEKLKNCRANIRRI